MNHFKAFARALIEIASEDGNGKPALYQIWTSLKVLC